MVNYVDFRKIEVQGTGIPHGGRAYSEALFNLLREKYGTSVYKLFTKKDLYKLTTADRLWSASPYDLLHDHNIQAKKYYVVHGFRDEELYHKGHLPLLSKWKYFLKQKKHNLSQKPVNALFIFPSYTTKIYFELYNKTSVERYIIAATPFTEAQKPLVSKVLKNQELDYTQNFLLLNANRREKNFIRCIKACELLREVYNINPMINYTSNKKITNTVGMKHLGYLSPEDLEKYIDNSILLFPSLSEGYGIEAKRSENIRILSGSLTMSWEHNIEPRTIFVDANSVVEIAAAIYLCMNNQYCNKLSVEYSDPVQTIIGLLDEDI